MLTCGRPGGLRLEQSTSTARALSPELQSPADATQRWLTWHRRLRTSPTHPTRVCHNYRRSGTSTRSLQRGLGGRDVHGDQHD